jgi:ATP-dependent DNA helicase RecG
MKKANAAKRVNFRYAGIGQTLNKLGLAKGEKLLKAAEVLFCNDNNVEVQAAVFAGTDKLTFLDIRVFHGNIFSLMEQSESYLKEHMDWRAKLTGEGREEIPEIPVRAVKEAIMNSLCHRDYTNPKGNEVAVFRDRIEIYNPGKFPEGYSPEDFISGREKSMPQNPLIANALYLCGDIERWGSGIRRIHEACKGAGVGVDFQVLKSGFQVVFHRPESQTSREKAGERLVEGLVEGLVETQKKILELARQNPTVSKREMAEKIGISATAIDKNIAALKKKGLLKRVGPDRGGRWEVAAA